VRSQKRIGDVPNVVFLPGAAGARDFWRPVSERLPNTWIKTLHSWPGAGREPHDPRVQSFRDLIARVASEIDDQSDLVAQSMGGIVAIGVALRYPRKVRRLVLVATSGGLDVGTLGAGDWRAQYQAEYPSAARWIWQERVDYSNTLPGIRVPTLLIWGDADPISPLSVGHHLARLLPHAALQVVPGGTHSLAHDHPEPVAELISEHLRGGRY
jgi:pimeloyl-ACP methyl ester carboxylesterase